MKLNQKMQKKGPFTTEKCPNCQLDKNEFWQMGHFSVANGPLFAFFGIIS